jgi:uncharacterized surface protein with fasciclin (FAS1) repeats
MLFRKLLLALPALVSAQNTTLQSVLGSNSNLTTLAGLIQAQPQLLSALGSAKDITILAPSNAALATLLNSTAGAAAASDPGFIAALLQYHVLNGTFYSSQVTNTSTFIPTLLTNATYTNVTGGQRVEAISSNGTVSIISGLFQNSTVIQAVRLSYPTLQIYANLFRIKTSLEELSILSTKFLLFQPTFLQLFRTLASLQLGVH